MSDQAQIAPISTNMILAYLAERLLGFFGGIARRLRPRSRQIAANAAL